MIFKKNALTYIANSFLVLFLAGLLLLCVDRLFKNDIAFSLLFGAGCILFFALVFICTYFTCFLFRKISKKAFSTVLDASVLFILLSVCLYQRMYDVSWYLLLYNALMVIIMYIVVRIGAGRIAAFFTAALLSGIILFDVFEIFPYDNVFIDISFAIIVFLYVLYYKRCNSGQMKTVLSWVFICVLSVVCGISAFFAIIFLVLLFLVFVFMLFKAWKQALVALGAGIMAFILTLTAFTVFTGINYFEEKYDRYSNTIYEYTENIETKGISLYEDYFDNTESDFLVNNFPVDGDLYIFAFIIIAFISAIIMYFGERYVLMPFLVYLVFLTVYSKRVTEYIIVLCFAYGIQTCCDRYRRLIEKRNNKNVKKVEKASVVIEEKNKNSYNDNEDFIDVLPVPMSLIDSVCVIKVIDKSGVKEQECWEKRKLRSVVKALKKYYESEDRINE